MVRVGDFPEPPWPAGIYETWTSDRVGSTERTRGVRFTKGRTRTQDLMDRARR